MEKGFKKIILFGMPLLIVILALKSSGIRSDTHVAFSWKSSLVPCSEGNPIVFGSAPYTCACLNSLPSPSISDPLPFSSAERDALFHPLAMSYLQLTKAAVLNLIYDDQPFKITGEAWPGQALTMVGLRRLDNLQAILQDCIASKVSGDFIEAGAWRGGASIFAASVFHAYGQLGPRIVWVADSFQGIPPVNTTLHPADKAHVGAESLEIHRGNSEAKVWDSFSKFGFSDPKVVRLLTGYFEHTLPRFAGRHSLFAVVRLDGDTYASTLQSLTWLYPRLSIGGYVIIDDFFDWIGCFRAVSDYRTQHKIDEAIVPVWHKNSEAHRGAWWRKTKQIQF